MKKFLGIVLWIVSFCFSGFLYEPASDYIKEKRCFSQGGSLDLWLNSVKYTNLQFIIFVLILVLFVFIGYILISVYQSHVTKIEKNSPEELIKNLNSFVDDKKNIKVTWDVYFSTQYNTPLAHNIQKFCLHHNPPQLMGDYGCGIYGCPNENLDIDKEQLDRTIKSLLLAKYDELKRQKHK